MAKKDLSSVKDDLNNIVDVILDNVRSSGSKELKGLAGYKKLTPSARNTIDLLAGIVLLAQSNTTLDEMLKSKPKKSRRK